MTGRQGFNHGSKKHPGFQPVTKGKHPPIQKDAIRHMPQGLYVKKVEVETGENTAVYATSAGVVYRKNYNPDTKEYTKHYFNALQKLLWRTKIKKAFKKQEEEERREKIMILHATDPRYRMSGPRRND